MARAETCATPRGPSGGGTAVKALRRRWLAALGLALALTAALAALVGATHDPPTNVTVGPHPFGVQYFYVQWQAPTPAPDSYKVQWIANKNPTETDWDSATEADQTGTQHSILGLTEGAWYTVRVGAVHTDGHVAWAAPVTRPAGIVCDSLDKAITDTGYPGTRVDTLAKDCQTLLNLQWILDPDDTLNWSPDLVITSWDGIDVSQRSVNNNLKWFVDEVEPKDKGLTGVIPDDLGKLPQLRYLDLGGNALTGTIPDIFGTLPELRILNLRNNDFTGTIPAGVLSHNTIIWLILDGNRLSGSIPTALGNMTQLHLLYLSNNQFTGEIPAELGNFPALWRLLLNGNQLTGEIPAGEDAQGNATGLARLTRLESLWLHDNQLTGEVPAALVMTSAPADGCVNFQTAPCMDDLRLHKNRLTGELPAELAQMTNLARLHVNCNAGLSGAVPAGLGDITTLTHLGINGTGLTLGADAKAKLATQVAAGVLACAAAPAPASTPTPTPAPAPAPAPQPRLSTTLTAAPDPVTVGETITYTLTVTNTGQVPLTGLFWRSPELGVGRSDIGDGRLAVGAAVAATLTFGPVTAEHLPGPIVVNVYADSDQTDDVRAALGVAVRAALAPAATPTPTPGPRPGISTLALTIDRAWYSAPDPPEPHLGHNILDLSLTLADDTPVACDFLTYYEATGGLARWGYAISEIVEERLGALTQYYQRGAVDCHFRAGRWRVERRLTWDFLGGGEWGAPDLGVEPHLLSDQPGELLGPWGHRVSNQAVDGTVIGFLDFYEALGGVRAFGYPKTEARRDDHPAAVLRLPGATPGFIRQYFQAAVFEYHPDDPAAPVKFGLAGELMRDLIYPGGAYLPFRSFRPVPPLAPGQPYTAERVIWGHGG